MRRYFITGTGTDIGKTWLTVGLCRRWKAAGVAVDALKPVMSGYDDGNPEASDAGALLAALGRPVTEQEVARIAPWRYRAALSPDMAAAREDRAIDFDALVASCRRPQVDADVLLIEGVGGCMVPLDDVRTVRDWIRAVDMPAVLVAGSYLGSLSHTLTAVASLLETAIPVAALVVNESVSSPVALAETVAVLGRHAPGFPLFPIERTEPEPGIARLADFLLGLA